MTPNCEKHGCYMFAEGTPERPLCMAACRLETHAAQALVPAAAAAPASLVVLSEQEQNLLGALVASTKSPGTRRKYLSAWRTFSSWAETRGAAPTPPVDPGLVLAYVLHRAPEVSPSALAVDLAAINAVHVARGFALRKHPQLTAALAGHRRTWEGGKGKAAALRKNTLVQIVESIQGDGLRAARDRALLLVGYAGALRRSELGAIRMRDLRFEPEGVILTLPRSKTDQEGKGRQVAIAPAKGHACPVVYLRAWIQAARADAPPSAWLWLRFARVGAPTEAPSRAAAGLSGEAVQQILRYRAAEAGLDASRLSGHSLRRGWITEAAVAGAHTRDIRRQTGHNDIRVLEGYVDDADVLGRTPKVL